MIINENKNNISNKPVKISKINAANAKSEKYYK
jgi:hypothetical protein